MSLRNSKPCDEEIVRLLEARDPEAVRLILDKYSGELTGFLLRAAGVVLFDHEVEEIINTAVWQVWQSYRADKGPLRHWLYRLTDTARVDWIRRESRHWRRRASLEQLSPAEEPFESPNILDKMEFVELVGRAIEQMPPRERQVFLGDVHAGGRANADELAAEIGASKDTIYQMRRRYKERLRNCIYDNP